MKYLTKTSENPDELIVQRCNEEMFCNALESFVISIVEKSARPFIEFCPTFDFRTGREGKYSVVFNLPKSAYMPLLFCPFCGGSLSKRCYEISGTDPDGNQKTLKVVYESFPTKVHAETQAVEQ